MAQLAGGHPLFEVLGQLVGGRSCESSETGGYPHRRSTGHTFGNSNKIWLSDAVEDLTHS